LSVAASVPFSQLKFISEMHPQGMVVPAAKTF